MSFFTIYRIYSRISREFLDKIEENVINSTQVTEMGQYVCKDLNKTHRSLILCFKNLKFR